jgi:ketosteroid isomerase-like protein
MPRFEQGCGRAGVAGLRTDARRHVADNVEIYERMMAAFNEGGFDAVVGNFDEDVELFDPDMPDGGVVRGREAVRELMNAITGSFARLSVRGYRLIPAGDRILALTHIHGQGEGRRGEMEIELRDAHVMTFRDGKIVYWRMYTDRNEAIRDMGLDPADYTD